MIIKSAHRRLATLAILLMPAVACLEGPFEHANPLDGDSDLTLAIAGGADTLRVVGDAALFQLVTTPVTSGLTPQWATSAPAQLASAGLGRYVFVASPSTPTTVQVTVRLGAHAASRNVVLMPAP